jgi:hypothetical protein
MRVTVAAALLAGVLSVRGADVTSSTFESKFYKEIQLFSTAPGETAIRTPIEHFGPVGIGIDLLLPPFQMQVRSVAKGSPAEATGKIKVGQMIETINGEKLKDIDPRIQLGAIITRAEATDGVIKFMIKEKPDAKAEEVVVNIPVLGTYSKTWPLNCPKSAKIVRSQADWLAKTHADGMGLGLLYLLSTGEDKDLEVARGWVKELVAKYKGAKKIDTFPWAVGYGGYGLCEYYLRTGDESILPIIEMYADNLKNNMYNGGWNGRGGVNFSYGHMNAAGVHSVSFLLLARECGVKVDEFTLQESLKHHSRFAGHNNVSYGDNLPEGGFVDNGKVGGLAFTMAAAATLTPEGEQSVYAKARDVNAIKSFYSTSWMFHGHTGGGIGEIWRGAAMGLMADKKPLKYREFMDNRQWFYELSRHYDGSMGIVGNHHGGGGYDDPRQWGIGIALAYTIPRKTLRITGAPPTKFCKTYQLPKRPWGTEADEAFYSLVPGKDKNGKVQDVDAEKLATDASWPILRRVNDPKATDETLLMYARHPDQGVRDMATQVIAKQGRDHLVLELLKDKDPRARYSGVAAGRLNSETVPILLAMINDPKESWWVVQHALTQLGHAKMASTFPDRSGTSQSATPLPGSVSPDQLAPHVDRLCELLQHDEWWLRRGALTALTGLVADERYCQKVWPVIGKVILNNRVASALDPLPGVVARLKEAKPEVQALAMKAIANAYGDYPKTLTAPGGLNLSDRVAGNSPVDWMETMLAGTLASMPCGLDALYTLAKARFPEKNLPHRELFLGASQEQLGQKVEQAVKPTILNSLIPEHVGKNWKSLQALAKADVATSTPGGRTDVMDQLADLYKRAGDTTDHAWHAFGPDRRKNEWDYLSFDPSEQKLWDGTGRYRPVTIPGGVTNWSARDFDPAKAGWKTGLAPFVTVNGKLQAGICKDSPCACADQPATLWEKEVLLMRRTFDLPAMKPGHRYRLLVGGRSHVGCGDGFAVYVNGRQMVEIKGQSGRNSGGIPKGAFISTNWFNDFQGGKVEVAAIAFVSGRKDKPNNHINIWFEEMKMPPFSEEQVRTWAADISLLSAAWQALQDPSRNAENPEAGRFKWDGKVVANPALLGTWTTVAVVPAVEAFDPAKPVDANKAPFKEITFKDDGKTDEPLRLWTGDLLMDLGSGVYTPLQALKMTLKGDNLFIEAGGFSDKNPVGWKSQLVVLKKK